MGRFLNVIAPLSLLTFTVALPVLAQESTGPTASESMKQACQDTAGAGKNLYEGTKTAFDDTKITAKVKVALPRNEETKGSDIDVHTAAGVVVLSGKVPSERIATRAEELAENTEGVKNVENRLRVMVAVP